MPVHTERARANKLQRCSSKYRHQSDRVGGCSRVREAARFAVHTKCAARRAHVLRSAAQLCAFEKAWTQFSGNKLAVLVTSKCLPHIGGGRTSQYSSCASDRYTKYEQKFFLLSAELLEVLAVLVACHAGSVGEGEALFVYANVTPRAPEHRSFFTHTTPPRAAIVTQAFDGVALKCFSKRDVGDYRRNIKYRGIICQPEYNFIYERGLAFRFSTAQLIQVVSIEQRHVNEIIHDLFPVLGGLSGTSQVVYVLVLSIINTAHVLIILTDHIRLHLAFTTPTDNYCIFCYICSAYQVHRLPAFTFFIFYKKNMSSSKIQRLAYTNICSQNAMTQ
ncbi:hypothetical protein J6590_081647 [Homalodisca vitripennis]|nr:hypothetical protein J6590_081647 [Homalodisca vitripennis]